MKELRFTHLKIVLVLTFCFSQLLGMAQNAQIPKKPSFIPPIIDSTNTLSEIQKTQLYDKLKKYSDSTSTEILVMIVATTQGQDISRYATELGQKWQIGQKGKDNGIVFLIAKNDRKLNINSGYGTEHLLTDALSRRIIEEVVKPEFKNGNYYQGIDNGTSAIIKVMNGEYKNDAKKSVDYSRIIFFAIIFIIFLIIISRNKGNGTGSRLGGAPSLLDVIILSSMGRSGGGDKIPDRIERTALYSINKLVAAFGMYRNCHPLRRIEQYGTCLRIGHYFMYDYDHRFAQLLPYTETC